MIYQLGTRNPQVAPDAYVAPGAHLIGSVVLEAGASVWFNVVLRGDNDELRVGERSNVQDNSVLHTDDGIPLTIGRGCTIGHMVMLHGCSIGDNTLVGIGSVILNRARIGANCLIGARSLITEGKEIPDNSMVMGSPAKVVRTLTPEEVQRLQWSAQVYVDNAKRFRSQLEIITQLPGAGDHSFG